MEISFTSLPETTTGRALQAQYSEASNDTTLTMPSSIRELTAEIEELQTKRETTISRIGHLDQEILDLEEEVSEHRDDVGDARELLHGTEWREEKIQQLSEEKYEMLQDVGEYGRLILELEKELSRRKFHGAGEWPEALIEDVD